eukprot:scaffold5479_cov199-Amphora_coffeaeformis.AAC.16
MPSSSQEVLQLKRQALECKKAGDLEGAKSFLRQAKQLEAAELQQPRQPRPQRQQAAAAVATAASESTEITTTTADTTEILIATEKDASQEHVDTVQIPEDPVNKAMDEATLDELHPMNADNDNTNAPFTAEEMLDTESLQDLRDCGMEIPSADDYQARILQYKRKALAYKQAQEIAKAKQHLQTAKQLQAAMQVLYGEGGTGTSTKRGGTGIGTATATATDDGEPLLDAHDLDLLAELQNYTDDGQLLEDLAEQSLQLDDDHDNNKINTLGCVLDMDDLDEMDVGLLRDVLEAGMQVPRPEDVRQRAAHQQATAVAMKKQGNLQAAKTALAEYKRLTVKANQLEAALKAMHNGTQDGTHDPDAALEKLVQAAEEPQQKSNAATAATTNTTTSTATTETKSKLQSSAHYKAQAVQFKQQGEKEKALAALRLYKQAAAAEAAAQTATLQRECMTQLQAEIQLATVQSSRFAYYQYFCDAAVGTTMAAGWRRYARDCATLLYRIERATTAAKTTPNNHKDDTTTTTKQEEQHTLPSQLRLPLQRSTTAALQQLPDISFVGTSCDVAETRLEFTVLQVCDLQQNKHLRDLILVDNTTTSKTTSNTSNDGLAVTPEHLQVHVTVHLPANADALEQDVVWEFQPTRVVTEGSDETATLLYTVDQSQFLHAERGTSRLAKTLTRRLSRRRCVSLEVRYVRPKKAPKSLFGRSKTTEVETIVLGSAGMELSALMETNFVAVELPLLEGRKPLGGFLRVAVRSGSPFGNVAAASDAAPTSVPQKVSLQGYPHFLLPSE